jgi:hypothetical protein
MSEVAHSRPLTFWQIEDRSILDVLSRAIRASREFGIQGIISRADKIVVNVVGCVCGIFVGNLCSFPKIIQKVLLESENFVYTKLYRSNNSCWVYNDT